MFVALSGRCVNINRPISYIYFCKVVAISVFMTTIKNKLQNKQNYVNFRPHQKRLSLILCEFLQ